MKAAQGNTGISVGDTVTFEVNGDGEILTGTVIEADVAEVDGNSTEGWDEPTHIVATEGCGSWAIHPSWIRGVRRVAKKPAYRFNETLGNGWEAVIIGEAEGWPERITGFATYEAARDFLAKIGAVWADYDI
jgi:hypothetical protein